MKKPRRRPRSVLSPRWKRRKEPRDAITGTCRDCRGGRSRPQNHALAGDERAGPLTRRCLADAIHGRVVVARIVMEDDEGLRVGGIGDPHAFLPSGMTPLLEARVFLVGIGAI